MRALVAKELMSIEDVNTMLKGIEAKVVVTDADSERERLSASFSLQLVTWLRAAFDTPPKGAAR